jgi:predicted XRE-type DNA-binding protein
MKTVKTTKTAKGQRFQSVWDALEDTPEEAEAMKLRSKLMLAVQDRIRASGVSQREAAKLIGVTQPRVSDLMRNRIDLFSVESLVNMLLRLGMKIEFRVKPAAHSRE